MPRRNRKSTISQSFLRSFLAHEAAGGIVLMAASFLGLVLANSAAANAYQAIVSTLIGGVSVQEAVNEGLMTLFFLLVGLEIKRELSTGALSTWEDRALPGIAALGGVVIPAGLYGAINSGLHGVARGWAVPTATDIAFALAVLSAVGRQAPNALRVFLTALAIVDDLIAVLIIAVFYNSGISFPFLAGAGLAFLGLLGLCRAGVTRLSPFLLLGVVFWFLVLRAGIHPTLAGVALALTVPLHTPGSRGSIAPKSPLYRLERALNPVVAYVVLPMFGFINAGVAVARVSLSDLIAPVPLGIGLGLLLGKQLGVFCASWCAIQLGMAALPVGTTWRSLYGVALICGVGFTMSLFVGALAFTEQQLSAAKIAIFAASLASGLLGAVVLRTASAKGPSI